MALLDYNGTPIVVGETVKLLGVVDSINESSPHYKEVTMHLTHPVPGVPANVPPRIEGANAHGSGADYIVKVCNLALIH